MLVGKTFGSIFHAVAETVAASPSRGAVGHCDVPGGPCNHLLPSLRQAVVYRHASLSPGTNLIKE